ncbi:DUF3142 domain-containing protein [Escherichia coli]|uniref:DUF3142 domain-containing protein n=1 Tax=Escherichia coli TaxID=562 RepID=UPI001FA9901B|nr:DUF3142 domain-containing protein [Escherichia coli]MCI5009018.1 DUF3142 domain-containing protein [Escherichia coli]
MPSCKRIFAASLLLICLGYGLHILFTPSQPLRFDQQVYIWQRVWTAEHNEALKRSRPLFSTLRVLGMQFHPQEGIRHFTVNTSLIKQDGRPVWLVARLEGQLTRLNNQQIIQHIQQTLREWQKAGITLVGVEIDYDAPTAKLPDYLTLLSTLHQALPTNIKLSITVLPTWLESPHLARLLRIADTSVLQVHNVLSPEKGLLDASLAQRWVKQYARQTTHPFFIALSAYGSALTSDNRVESEAPLYVAEEMRELSVSPQTIADFIQYLEQQPPHGLQGLVWFRLPLAGDRRAWSLTTLEAVIQHQPLTPRWSLIITQHADKQLFDLAFKNSGVIDASLPKQIIMSNADCLFADGASHYQVQPGPSSLNFVRGSARQLRAGESSPLGWARCNQKIQGEFNVIP